MSAIEADVASEGERLPGRADDWKLPAKIGDRKRW
jgi:hypothetical protein